MAMEPFKIEKIGEIDSGSLALAINKALHQAYLDCENRPGLGTAREVSIKMKMSPQAGDDGRLYRVDVAFELGKSFPKQGLTVAMKPGNEGLEFVPECPDNPDQRPLPFEDKDKDKPTK